MYEKSSKPRQDGGQAEQEKGLQVVVIRGLEEVRAMLTTLTRLRNLRLCGQLKYNSGQFIPDSRRGSGCIMIDDMARKIVSQLFAESDSIETLKVVF